LDARIKKVIFDKLIFLGLVEFLNFYNMDTMLTTYLKYKETKFQQRQAFLYNLTFYSNVLNYLNFKFVSKGINSLNNHLNPLLLNKLISLNKENMNNITNTNKNEMIIFMYLELLKKLSSNLLSKNQISNIQTNLLLAQISISNHNEYNTSNNLLSQIYKSDEAYIDLFQYYKDNVYLKQKKSRFVKKTDYKVVSLKESFMFKNNIPFNEFHQSKYNFYMIFSTFFTFFMQYRIFRYLKYIK